MLQDWAGVSWMRRTHQNDLPPANLRLEWYRYRVARLIDDQGGHAGWIFVEPRPYSLQTGGHLWWRRWSAPRYAAFVSIIVPWHWLRATDEVIEPDILDAELDDWDAGRYEFDGQVFALEWLDDEESARLAASEFSFRL